MTSTRRDFLKQATLLAPSLLGLAACTDADPTGPRRASLLSSTLEPCPECPELFIPPGFRCIKLSETTTQSRANPALRVPQALDGMAAFRRPGHAIRLIRNHEITDVPTTPLGTRPYDPLAGGGTTTLEIAVHRRGQGLELELTEEFVSLSGTLRNCAGGATPWGSWLTCEETVSGTARGFTRPHGYVFEVPVGAHTDVDAVPLPALGRFVHEAVATDPRSGVVYLTEDKTYDPPSGSPGSGFYRFLPVRRDDLKRGGRLQALCIDGRANYLTATGQVPGDSLPVRWIDIGDPDPANAETDPSAVFRQALAGGAAIFQRLEGCWYGDGSIFFNATSGGDAGRGQVWQYRPATD